MDVTLRAVTPDDEPFLYELYKAAHGDELPAEHLDASQREPLFRMQFFAQQQTYAAQFPDAEDKIILLDGQGVGRLLVERTESEIRGIDIALLPEYRSRGIGALLIQDLMAEAGASGRPFRIHVVKSNRANRLYQRLGLSITGESGMHFSMEGRLIDERPGRLSAGGVTMLDSLKLSSFSELLNTKFRVHTGDDSSVELELVEAKDLGSNARQERFSLLFRGPRDVNLDQKIYRTGHDGLGSFDLFIVPVGASETGRDYEAIFNRLL